jgi:hypothetical protein
MKKLVLTIALIANTGYISAQTTEVLESIKKQSTDTLGGWKTGGIVAINLTQVSLTNWTAGGQNSVSVNGVLSLFANLKKGNATWDNTLDLAYGLLQQGADGIRKTDDKIDFTSKYGRKAFKKLYFAGLVNFKSQMTAGYLYPDDANEISNFLAPAYVLGAIGLDYKPNEIFSLFTAPLTMKTTLVNNQKLANSGAYGVDAAAYNELGELTKNGLTMRTEYGAYFRTFFKKDILTNVNLQNKIELFSNFAQQPTNIDVNWEVLIVMKVNKFIAATITTQLLYDDDIDIAVDNNNDGVIDAIGPRTQFKEVLGVGLSYKF